MTICKKCGKEIPDGEELCEDCQNEGHDTGESYLDELMRDMGMDEYRNLEGHKLSERAVMSEEDEESAELPMTESELEELQNMVSGLEPEELPDVEAEPEEPEEPQMMEAEPEEPQMMEAEPEEPEEPQMMEYEPDEPQEPQMIEYEPEEPQEEEYGGAELQEEELSDDIDDLLDLLSQQDIEDEEENQDEAGIDISALTEDEGEEKLPEEKSVVVPEASFFSEDEGGAIFADDSDGKSEGTSVEDVFQDALSAVDYSGDNEEEDFFSLDEFGTKEGEEGESPEEDVVQSIAVADPSEAEAEASKTKQKKQKKEKGTEPGFWKRIFGNIITEQTAEEEAKERELEEASAEEKARLKEEKKQQDEAKKQEKAELAKAEKDRKAAEKAERATAKAAEKEEKKRLKLEREANEVVGKINPVGATIVMVFFGVIVLLTLLGTQTFSYSSAINGAESQFEAGDYQKAYEALAGVEVSESSAQLADKVRICMQLQKELNSYTNYYEMQMYLESLDSLMKGIRSYDTNRSKADEYEIMSQYNALESQVAQNLYDEFGVSESQARSINSTETQEEYTAKLEEIISRWEEKMRADER